MSFLFVCYVYISLLKKNISSVTKWLAAYILGKRLLLLMAQSNNDNNTTEEQHTPAIVSAYTPVAGWTTWISNEAHQHPADHLTWINPLKKQKQKRNYIFFFCPKGLREEKKKTKRIRVSFSTRQQPVSSFHLLLLPGRLNARAGLHVVPNGRHKLCSRRVREKQMQKRASLLEHKRRACACI